MGETMYKKTSSYTHARNRERSGYVPLMLVAGLMVAGCCTPPQVVAQTSPVVEQASYRPATSVVAQTPPVVEPSIRPVTSSEIKITAVGYGASSSFENYTPGQKRLMAMRASKLDAYRALAEQVQGVRINGNSTVSAMMAQVDGFRVFVDAYLRGAQVMTVTSMADGNYETTLELTLDSKFFNSFPRQMKDAPSMNGSNIKGAVGPGAAYGTNFYYSE